MSLLKTALVVAALTAVTSVATAQPGPERSPAVTSTKPAPPIAEHPTHNTKPATTSERAKASERAKTPERAKTTEVKTSEPSVWDQTKSMTRKQWNKARKTWAMERDKWRDCNRQSRARKLTAPESWSFIASCMTK
jgi:hypothetical protein